MIVIFFLFDYLLRLSIKRYISTTLREHSRTTNILKYNLKTHIPTAFLFENRPTSFFEGVDVSLAVCCKAAYVEDRRRRYKGREMRFHTSHQQCYIDGQPVPI